MYLGFVCIFTRCDWWKRYDRAANAKRKGERGEGDGGDGEMGRRVETGEPRGEGRTEERDVRCVLLTMFQIHF